MTYPALTPDQDADVHRFADVILDRLPRDALAMARLLASTPDDQLLGRTKFQLRDLAHRSAAGILEAAPNERKRGGNRGPA